MASTTAHNISHPARPETATACTIPRGTVTAAPTVSSAALAEASKPVIVYAGSRKPSAKSKRTARSRATRRRPRAPL